MVKLFLTCKYAVSTFEIPMNITLNINIVVNLTPIASLSPSKPKANILSSGSVNIKPSIAINIQIINTIVNILFVNFRDFFSPKLAFISQYNGINVVDNAAPIAANITFGIFIVAKYISVYMPAPYTNDSTCSLAKPIIFDSIVTIIRPTAAFATLLIIFSLLIYYFSPKRL